MTASSDLTPDLQAELASYLGFLADHELDLIYSETPNNLRLEENKSPIRQPVRGPVAVPNLTEVSANVNSLQPHTLRGFDLDAALADAKALIAKAETLEALYEGIEGFSDIPLRQEGGKRMIRGRGAAPCELMLIIDPPDRAEDDSGDAASGPQGRLLDQIIKAAGFTDAAYICHAAFWKPAGQGPLNEADIALNQLFLKAIIKFTQPKGVLLMGACAARTLIGATEGIMKLRAQTHSLTPADNQPSIRIVATFAPGFLMRQPQAKAMVWADILSLKSALNNSDKSE